jgi:arylsulfatase A-like enzyme
MPAFAYWPGVIAPHTASAEVISTMDVLPSILALCSSNASAQLSGRVLDGKPSLATILTDRTGTAKSAHTFLPFYNNPIIANASSLIFAARFGQYHLPPRRNHHDQSELWID